MKRILAHLLGLLCIASISFEWTSRNNGAVSLWGYHDGDQEMLERLLEEEEDWSHRLDGADEAHEFGSPLRKLKRGGGRSSRSSRSSYSSYRSYYSGGYYSGSGGGSPVVGLIIVGGIFGIVFVVVIVQCCAKRRKKAKHIEVTR